jgi:outer membrane protein assembly factor BamC
VTAIALAALLAACSSTDGLFSGDRVDYRDAAAKTKPLEVPPDLSQLARESRYQPQAGVVSASTVTTAAPAPAAAQLTPASVAPAKMGNVRIERQGQQRWLVVPQTPEQLWPQLRSFWEKNGFTLAVDNPQTGVMETQWSENRAKLPNDVVRNTIGRLLRNLYDTGERDLFRTRVERSAEGSEIFISHRGVQEVYTDAVRENTTWRARPTDPGLEAEFLGRLMVALTGKDDAPRGVQTAAVAAATASVAAAPEPPPRARVMADAGGSALEVDEPFDRAWRRVGLALDRSGFTVEDRDRAQGIYFVRYVDPTTAGQEEPNFFARVFAGAKDPQTPVRYRIALKANGAKTTLSVLTSAGAPEAGENGKRIVAQLFSELK